MGKDLFSFDDQGYVAEFLLVQEAEEISLFSRARVHAVVVEILLSDTIDNNSLCPILLL